MFVKNSSPTFNLLVFSWLPFLIRLFLGLVFMVAGIVKLSDPKAFARVISQYEMISESFLPVVAIGLPVLELLAGLGVVLAIRGSLSLMFSLLIFFVIILWYGILSNLNVDCGCFSNKELQNQVGLWQAFYRDLVMLGGILLIYGFRWRHSIKDNPRPFWAKIKRII